MFQLLDVYGAVLQAGLWETARINALAIGLGLPFSLALLACRLSSVVVARFLAGTLIELAKGIPVLVVMFWLYLCVPLVSPVRLTAVTAAVLALSLNYAINAAEIFRSTWRATPADLRDSLTLNGQPGIARLALYQGPHVLLASAPGLLALVAATIKLSAVAAFISVPEIFHATQGVIQQTYRPVELYTMLAVVYLALVLLVSLGELLVRRLFTPSPQL